MHLLLVLALLSTPLQSPQGDASHNQSRQPQADKRGTDSFPVAVKLLNTGISEREATEQSARVHAEEEIGRSTLQWIRITGFATAILAAFTLLLWFATRSMAKDGKETAKRQLRAYIGVKGSPLGAIPSAGQPVTLGIDIQNFGATPAYNVQATVFWAITKHPHDAADTPQAAAIEPKGLTGFVLDPGEQRKVSSTVELAASPAEAEAIQTGQMRDPLGENHPVRLCIRGQLTFTDAFGDKHSRTYCHFYGGSFGVNVMYCPLHNTAD